MSFDGGGGGDRLIVMYVVDVLGDFVLGFCPPVTLLTIYIFFYWKIIFGAGLFGQNTRDKMRGGVFLFLPIFFDFALFLLV